MADNKDAILVVKEGEELSGIELPKDLKDAQALESPPIKDAEETKNVYNDTNNEPFNMKEDLTEKQDQNILSQTDNTQFLNGGASVLKNPIQFQEIDNLEDSMQSYQNSPDTKSQFPGKHNFDGRIGSFAVDEDKTV